MKESLQKGDAGREVFEFVVEPEKPHGRMVLNARLIPGGDIAVGQQHGPRDGGGEDANDFQGKGTQQQEPRRLLEQTTKATVGLFGGQEFPRFGQSGQDGTTHQCGRCTQIRTPIKSIDRHFQIIHTLGSTTTSQRQ